MELVFWIMVGGVIGAFAFSRKQQSAGAGFFLGMLLGPLFAWLLFLGSDGRYPCPHCAERIKRAALVCPHCHRNVTPPATPQTSCAECGGLLRPGDTACRFCKAPVSATD